MQPCMWATIELWPIKPLVLFKQSCDLPAGQALPFVCSAVWCDRAGWRRVVYCDQLCAVIGQAGGGLCAVISFVL